MARLVVDAGGCGNEIVITVKKAPGNKGGYTLKIASGCEFVSALADDLPVLDRMDALTGIQQNPVYRAAAARLKHPACPVPSGILKALEVAAQLNVPRDVSMVFDK